MQQANLEELIYLLLEGKLILADLPLSPDECHRLVLKIKSQANHYWSIDPRESVRRAELIIEIGTLHENVWQTALGKMALGDALKFLGDNEKAWEYFQEAARLFLSIDDEVGWARTRIGPLIICIELNIADQILTEAAEAAEILKQHEQWELLLNLEMNRGMVYQDLRNCRAALDCFDSALRLAESLGENGEQYLGRMNNNLGYTHFIMGNLQLALKYLEQAKTICTHRQEVQWLSQIELNIASVLLKQGHYRRALQLLHQAQQQAQTDASPRKIQAYASHRIVECYLALNRSLEARELALKVIEEYEALKAPFSKAVCLFNLATAEAELGRLEAAQSALEAAEQVFIEMQMQDWLPSIGVWRATIALKQNNPILAYSEASNALNQFSDHFQVSYVNALLRQGQALHALHDLAGAAKVAQEALRRALHSRLALSRYNAHLLLGQLAEAKAQYRRAYRHYWAASTSVERVQKGLSLTLRTSFLDDKADALRSLIRLYLQDGQKACAYETLERAKSQTFFTYLGSRDSLHWGDIDPDSRQFQSQFEQLREEYQMLYRVVREEIPSNDSLTPEQARRRLAECEKQLLAIRERLYLQNPNNPHSFGLVLPDVTTIQQQLAQTSLLIEYYNDGQHLWAFVLDSTHLEVIKLPAALREVNHWIQQLQFNINCVLQAGRHGSVVKFLTHQFRDISCQLYSALLGPLAAQITGKKRLTIVPYGILHYLPFHLLTSDNGYLIEQHEIVVLPAGGLITQPSPVRQPGAVVVAHAQNGRLPQTVCEAQMVHHLLGGQIYVEDQATRNTLQQTPCQVLHIAAHGEFRMDYPDLAYIELADGQLFTDDLLQHDLSYELVTLSACETGRASITSSDEPIGLGRGCLYAGAGALLVSLWRVEDNGAYGQMETVYQLLKTGESKASAIRQAQCTQLSYDPDSHPAYWGAFQLIGNPDPFSNQTRLSE